MTNHTPRDTGHARLAAEALSVGYDGHQVLMDIDLAIPTEKMTVLVGANGSGKSTLLKTMARILSPAAGTVRLDGQAIHCMNTRDVARQMGLLPQGPVAPEGLSVHDLVTQGRFPHQGLLRQWTQTDKAAVETAMRVADISDLADRPVDTLSGGQRQRAWIAMVLAQETEFLLLDEPTTFLDLKVQVELMELLSQLAHEDRRTLVIVLHELNLAAAYADHLVMIKEGRIVVAGRVSDVFNAQNLKSVFDLDADVVCDPKTGRLWCIPEGAYARRKSRERAA